MNKTEEYKIDKNKVRRNFSNALNYDDFTSYHNITLKMTAETIRNCFDEDILSQDRFILKNILDIGCGTGQGYFILNELMPNYNFNYLGLDFAPGLLSKARHKLKGVDSLKNISLICADAESLPLKYKKFDVIFSNMMLHWLNNTEHFLRSIEAVLKDSGTFILSYLTQGTLSELSECVENTLYKEQTAEYNFKGGAYAENFTLNKFHNLNDIEKKIINSGLIINKHETFEYIDTADSSMELLKRINGLGAKNTFNEKQLSPASLRRVLNNYDERYRDNNNKVFATYKIKYLVINKSK